MAFAHLSIGTATNRINLLNAAGFGHVDWRPKAGPTTTSFRQSSLADYRHPVAYVEATAIETFVMILSGASQDAVIRTTQDLRRLLREALNYWAQAWRDDVVYLQAQASCETNARYAVVVAAELPEDEDPFGPTFNQLSGGTVMDQLTLIVEREAWTENAPGTGTLVDLSSINVYNGITFGNVDDTEALNPTGAEGEVYFVNHWLKCNLTHVHYYDSAGLAWSPNLLGVLLPHAFLPNPPVAGDCVVFGINSALADSGPFWSLVFDIASVITGVTGIEWRYSSVGNDPIAQWCAFNPQPQDNTEQDGVGGGVAFDTLGTKSVHWDPSAVPGICGSWDTRTPTVGAAALITTGYWVAAVVTAATGAGTPPIQQHRNYYTISWPSFDYAITAVGGDMSAIGKLTLRHQAQPALVAMDKVVIGSRSISRGENFSSFINLANEQTPPGVTVAASGGGAFAANVYSPTFWCVQQNNVPAAWTDIAQITINSTYGLEWYGRYRVFLRGETRAYVATTPQFRLKITSASTPAVYTPPAAIPMTHFTSAADLGVVDLPSFQPRVTSEIYDIVIVIQGYGDGTMDFYLTDLILIPVDEWAMELVTASGESWGLRSTANLKGTVINIDSITSPKNLELGLVTEFVGDEVYDSWTVYGSQLRLQNNGKIRFHLFQMRYSSANADWRSRIGGAGSVQLLKNQRYLSMRGDR